MNSTICKETPEERVHRRAFCACVTAEVKFCRIQDGLCHFDACYTWLAHEPAIRLSVPVEDGLTTDQIVKQIGVEIERNKPVTANPEVGEWWCPNGHDSCLPPRLPELMFEACEHYRLTKFTWNEFCITCGVRHIAFRIYWSGHDGRLSGRGQNPKHYCGYCGAKMVAHK